MKTISRYIMTLALLLTAVTGAWADETPKVVFEEHFVSMPNNPIAVGFYQFINFEEGDDHEVNTGDGELTIFNSDGTLDIDNWNRRAITFLNLPLVEGKTYRLEFKLKGSTRFEDGIHDGDDRPFCKASAQLLQGTERHNISLLDSDGKEQRGEFTDFDESNYKSYSMTFFFASEQRQKETYALNNQGELAEKYYLSLSIFNPGLFYLKDVVLYEIPSAAPSVPLTRGTGDKINEWTFAMPANDVVLTPIYSAATIYSGETETPFETLKEAFANVKDGDVIKLDWNVTLTETLETPTIDGGVKFTLDFNGYTLDCGTTYQIKLKNAGDQLTFTDRSDDQLGGLIAQNFNVESGSELVFDAGRYNLIEATAERINAFCANASIPFSLAEGKEFVDLEGGAEANDGFTLRVGFKTYELTIGPKKFATFYADKNITFAEQPAENVGLYTISSIDADRSTATVTPISGIIPAGTPMLVYNGTEQEQTAKLIVTLDNAQNAITWAPEFKGTAIDLEFTADAMAAADYYALSGGKAFAPVKGAGTLGANQCWLQFDKQEIPSARQFTLVFDETTGLSEELRVKSEEFATATWYTLDGRKIAAPTKKGIYIMNGKKIVVK